MQFKLASVLALLSSTSVLAAPLGERATTPASAIASTLSSLNTALSAYESTISTSATTIKNDVSASVQIIAAINANLAGIATQLQTAGTQIGTQTVGLVNGGIATLTGLGQSELDMLAADIQTTESILLGVSASLAVVYTDLTPNVQASVDAEVQAVKAAIQPFVAPIQSLAAAVMAAPLPYAVLTIKGVQNASAGLQAIVAAFKATNGGA